MKSLDVFVLVVSTVPPAGGGTSSWGGPALAVAPSADAVGDGAAAPHPSARAAVEFDHGHRTWTEVLRERMSERGFDYKALKNDRSKLDRYLASLEAVTPQELGAWSREQEYAFWINAYNAYTVAKVVEHYPVGSIKEIGSIFTSVWDQKFIPLARLHPGRAGDKGDKLTLNDIEHGILRPRFKDARVHAAVNCASRGCPPLFEEAFTADRLDEQLDEQARRWIADTARNRLDRTGSRIEISKIFDWFREDFERDAGSVQAWVARYAPNGAAAWLRDARNVGIDYLDYSWKLNEAR
jgi:hypothetical protein